MREAETEPDMVRRHVENGAQHVAKQRALIARLRRKDLPTADAEVLLATFEDLQRQHQDHLMRIEAPGREGPL